MLRMISLGGSTDWIPSQSLAGKQDDTRVVSGNLRGLKFCACRAQRTGYPGERRHRRQITAIGRLCLGFFARGPVGTVIAKGFCRRHQEVLEFYRRGAFSCERLHYCS